ncbi:MAG: hypothetical protein HQ518_33215 [Rhodopirellula sp.]|nr:hypothetical protein [Rhodopirellula sp.]
MNESRQRLSGKSSRQNEDHRNVGPACEDRDALRDLIRRGIDIFRLNFAHGSHEWLSEIVAKVRSLSEELDKPIGLLGDLPGPEIRLGELQNGSVSCPDGAIFTFVRGREPTRNSELTSTYEPLIDDLKAGDRILLADGTVGMRVEETNPQARYHAGPRGRVRNDFETAV